MFNYLSTKKTKMIKNKLNFLDDEVYLPEFLNTREKWVDEKITAFDFYTLMCLLEHDLTEHHKDEAFSALLLLVESLIHFFYYQMELNKH